MWKDCPDFRIFYDFFQDAWLAAKYARMAPLYCIKPSQGKNEVQYGAAPPDASGLGCKKIKGPGTGPTEGKTCIKEGLRTGVI